MLFGASFLFYFLVIYTYNKNMIKERPIIINTEYGKYRIQYFYSCVDGKLLQIYLNFPCENNSISSRAKYGYIVLDNNSKLELYSTSFKDGTKSIPCENKIILYTEIVANNLLISMEALEVFFNKALEMGFKFD